MARNSTKKNGVIPKENNSYLDKLAVETQSNQSRVSMVLGVLIVLVLGILVFNYFNKNTADLGPAQTIEQQEDVSPQNLPGKYTVKEGDTLFLIAEKYYQDGYKYNDITEANNLTDVNAIETGQVLEIPKISQEVAEVPLPSEPAQLQMAEDFGIGGGDTTIWGPIISGNTYTVVEDDWLSKIAGRAYGDIYAYQKIAEANNIPNPDLIEVGMVLTIPR